MLKNMTQRAGIQPYFTNHSLRATTVTVLSSVKVETQQIKAVTGHKSEASIESYCERPTLRQFPHISSALTSFIHGKENTLPEQAASYSSSSGSTKAVPSPQAEVVAVATTTTSISTIQDEHNVFIANGVNPSAILPSGSFHGRSFTFNININK